MTSPDHDARDERNPKDSADRASLHSGKGAASAMSELSRQRLEHPAAGGWAGGTLPNSVKLFTTWAEVHKQAIALEDELARKADAALAARAAALKEEAIALREAALQRFRQELQDRGLAP